ncbi:MAG: hypothetical protein ACKOTB_03855 [Planctomycetia bacterium]
MSPDAANWLDGLRAAAAPLPHSSSGAAAAAERSILAAHLVAWLDTELSGLLAERSRAGIGDAEPALVLTTSPTGIEVARDVLGRDDPLTRERARRIACVTERCYRLWCIRHPDPDHSWHVNHWSWIKTSVPSQRHAAFARWPLADGEAYWLHRTGTTGVGRDRRFTHLWRFDGRIATILKPFVDEGLGGL